MQIQAIAALVALAGMGLAGAAMAGGDAEAGKEKSASCASCHGADGSGVDPNPGLKGKDETGLYEALKAYKSGERENAIMNALTQSLSDQDMMDLAAYYASLK